MDSRIVDKIREMGADAWLIYDYASRNPAFNSLVCKCFMTRKCFVIVGADGNNTIVCHMIDAGVLENHGIPDGFKVVSYACWQEMIDVLRENLSRYPKVLMEVSENGLMPRSSFVDYGTVRLIQSLGCEVLESADLFQMVSSSFSDESYRLHVSACEVVTQIVQDAFRLIFTTVESKGEVSEYEIQQYILGRFAENDMVTDSNPIVAIAKNAANPHYEPTAEYSDMIRRGDLVLIDLWAKYDNPEAFFADITWMGYVGDSIPARYQELYDILRDASSAAIDFVSQNLGKRPIRGYEVDDVCRQVVNDAGYGQYFTHRTGHSISVGDSDHGSGVNIDNYETHDTRTLIDRIGFSIEPGIYIKGDVGVREECNVCIVDGKAVVTTPRQPHMLTPADFGIKL